MAKGEDIVLDHVVLHVSDFKEARTFYETLFSYASWEVVPDSHVFYEKLGFDKNRKVGFEISIR